MLVLLLLIASFTQATLGKTSPTAEDYFSQARQYFEKQEWDKARVAAGKALEANPQLADAEVLLGLIATAQNQFSNAEIHFQRAVSLQPENDQALSYLASTYLQQKRYSEAARDFDKALQLNPRNQAANYNRGLIALIQEKPAEALTYFERVHQANPSDVTVLTGILECQLLLKHSAESLQIVQKLEGMLQPQDPRLFQVATMLALHQQYDSAISILERFRQAYPRSYDVNYNLALAYLRSGKYDRAAGTLQSLLDQPKAAESYNLLAQVKEKQQLPDQALAAYQKAAELEPVNEDYRFDHAYALLQYLSIEAAMSAFSSGTHDFPKSWRMRVGLGSAYYLGGRYDAAVQTLLEAVELEPGAKVAYFLLGKAYESAGDSQTRIREVFRKYLEKKPEDAWAYYHYGNMLFLQAQAESSAGLSSSQIQFNHCASFKSRLCGSPPPDGGHRTNPRAFSGERRVPGKSYSVQCGSAGSALSAGPGVSTDG